MTPSSPRLAPVTPADLTRTVLHTVRCAVEADELRAAVPTRVTVRVPPRPGCGDYATNVALRLAKDTGQPAREIAEVLRRRLAREPGIARVEIAEPGFLNITLQGSSYVRLVRGILDGEGAPPARASRCTPTPASYAGSGRTPRGGRRSARPDSTTTCSSSSARATPSSASATPTPAPAPCCATPVTWASSHCPASSTTAPPPPLLAALGDHPPHHRHPRPPDRLARHLERAADAFLRWQADSPTLPRGDEKPSAVHRARLALAEATGKVLADGLTQLGITAPAHL
ncbi:hypothetical protein GCM10020000_25940 [Streptomyces olivoverticillatus]